MIHSEEELRKALDEALTKEYNLERISENLRDLNARTKHALKAEKDKFNSLLVEHESIKSSFLDLQAEKKSLQAKLEEISKSKKSVDILNTQFSDKITMMEVDLRLNSISLREETTLRETTECKLRESNQQLLLLQTNMGELKEAMRISRDQFEDSQHQRQILTGELKASQAKAASANLALKEAQRELFVLQEQQLEHEELLSSARREIEVLQKLLDSSKGMEGRVQVQEREVEEAITQLCDMEQKLITARDEAENYRMKLEARWSAWAAWTAVAVAGGFAASIGTSACRRA